VLIIAIGRNTFHPSLCHVSHNNICAISLLASRRDIGAMAPCHASRRDIGAMAPHHASRAFLARGGIYRHYKI
jgi:hypothetical protein